jgi:hypothetical protein
MPITSLLSPNLITLLFVSHAFVCLSKSCYYFQRCLPWTFDEYFILHHHTIPLCRNQYVTTARPRGTEYIYIHHAAIYSFPLLYSRRSKTLIRASSHLTLSFLLLSSNLPVHPFIYPSKFLHYFPLPFLIYPLLLRYFISEICNYHGIPKLYVCRLSWVSV